MGVAPYSWPHDREWQPGIHDKRANRGMWFVLMIYIIFFIGFTVNIGFEVLFGEGFLILLFWSAILVVLVVFFIMGQVSRRDIKVEEVKYFDLQPRKLSGLVMDVLKTDSIPHSRDGPHRKTSDDWLDTFWLLDRPWQGISLEVERNPLIARVNLASVTVRGSDSSREYIEAIKARIDQVVLQTHVERYEDGLRKTAPDLNVFDEPSIPHKPYDPPVP